MSKAEGDLKAILDLLAEWKEENSVEYVSTYILGSGSGAAYTLPSDTGYEVRCNYAKKEKEPAGSNRTGSVT